MIDQAEEYKDNCESLDKVIDKLEEVLSGPAVMDYEPAQPIGVQADAIEDTKFRAQQQKDKKVYQAALAAPKEEEKQSFADKVVDKIAGPEPIKPTSALAKKLANEKKSKLKQRLISASSESDTDSDGETFNRASGTTPKVDIE